MDNFKLTFSEKEEFQDKNTKQKNHIILELKISRSKLKQDNSREKRKNQRKWKENEVNLRNERINKEKRKKENLRKYTNSITEIGRKVQENRI